jgi:hypothetical protein
MKLGITNFESRGVLKCDSKLFLEEGVQNWNEAEDKKIGVF